MMGGRSVPMMMQMQAARKNDCGSHVNLQPGQRALQIGDPLGGCSGVPESDDFQTRQPFQVRQSGIGHSHVFNRKLPKLRQAGQVRESCVRNRRSIKMQLLKVRQIANLLKSGVRHVHVFQAQESERFEQPGALEPGIGHRSAVYNQTLKPWQSVQALDVGVDGRVVRVELDATDDFKKKSARSSPIHWRTQAGTCRTIAMLTLERLSSISAWR